MPYITTQEETTLSYLVGLAPVGEIVFVKIEQIFNDIRQEIPVRSHNRLAQILASLVKLRVIKRYSRSRYTVLKRPEDCKVLTGTKGWHLAKVRQLCHNCNTSL